MLIDKNIFITMLQEVAEKWIKNASALCEIDSQFGDGDHGVTIEKIAKLIQKKIDSWETASIKEFIDELGTGIMGIGGGSAGPLYGTMIGGLAEALEDDDEKIDALLLKKMFQESLLAMQDLTTAKIGDKTMMDALIPAVEAAQEADNDIPAILKATQEAANKGRDASKECVSKFGRARSYGERTIGTADAGAVSTALFFDGLAAVCANA